MLPRLLLLSSVAALLCSTKLSSAQAQGYYGTYIGKLKTLHHKVSGEVFAVDARTLHIRDFYYDGEGPAAYFYAGNSKSPSASGFRISDEKGSPNPLQRYQKKHVTITLPDGKTLNNIKWLSVWCEEFAVNFGDVKIPKNLDYPKPQKIDPLNGVHLVSSEPIVVVDAQTLLIPSFSYDGEAPDAKFWVGRGNKPSPLGIRVPDENGKENPLRKYDRKTIVLTLPGDTTIFDIGHFGVWCEAFTVDFGHVRIPKGLNVPPSLKMLGVAPQSKLNCEVLWDDLAFEVRWAVAGDSVVLQLVSKLEDGEYMSFGLSGDDTRSKMVGGDVVVAWVDKTTLKGFAYDYFLDAKSQCSGPRGSCPDERLRENTNNVRLLNAAMVNGYSIVTYQRPVKAQDELDRTIYTNGTQPIIWAIGPLNSRNEVSYHSITNKGDVFLDFGRPPKWNCPIPETDSSASASGTPSKPASEQQPPASEEVTTVATPRRRVQATPKPVSKKDAWYIPPIQCDEPEDGIFYAQMGPTGGNKHGYPAITGHVGWGISWYINGLLIPVINVVRGKTYTFYTEGGDNPDIPAKYHPFYITDDPIGGYEHKTPEERAGIRIFAGAALNNLGEPYPTGVGRLCNWTPDEDQPSGDEFASFGAYQRTLTLICDNGDPGVITWTPDKNTPDTVYYQCFSHRYLGWKINVLDSCDETAAGSEQIKIRVPAVEEDDLDEGEDDVEGELQGRPSIRVATRVKPNGVFINTKDEFSKQNEHKYIPLNEFPQLPSNTQQNFQQEFPFSYEPVTTESTIAQDEGTISEAFVPPPALQKEPIPSPQFENNESSISGQGVNASYQNPGVQLQNPTYYTYQMVKDVNSSGTQVDPNFAQQTGISIQLPSQQLVPTIINAQALPLGSIAPNQQLNPIALPNTQLLNPSQITVGSTQPLVNVQAQVNSVQAQIDASRNPTVVHTTTLQPIVNYSPPDETPVSVLSDEKTEPEVEAAASSAVNVTENNPEPAEPKSKIPVPNKAMGLIPGKMSHHTTLIPQAYSRIPIHPAMIFQRPLQPYTLAPHFRRPVPHRGFSRPPPPTIFRPQFAGAASTQHNYIIKKPFYRPPPQRPMTMPPQYHRPVGKPRIPMQHTATSIKTYHITLPPQNQPLKLRKVGTSTTTTSTTTPLPPPTQTQVDQSGLIKPSPSILPSDVIVLNARDTLTIPVAVNTGFNPHSVVVEGGFKPIITSKNAVAAASAQDRSAVVSDKEEEVQSVQEVKDADKQENEEIIDKSEEAMIAELASEVVAAISEEERKENPFQGQQPESFEPMFIPSPPDRRNGTDAKKPILPEGLMPPVPHLHHRNSPQPNRKNGHPYMMIRPRPGLVRRPLYPNNIVPPFRIRGSPTFRYQQSEEILEDETPMAAERMDSYYLPLGDSAIPPGVVVTYDGKSVADTGLSSPVGVKNIRAPIGTADFIRGTPQVVPYRGEIPPPVPENIRPESIPQLNKKNQQLAQSLPEQFKQQNDAFPDPPSIQSTQLKLVQNDELISEGSENKEVTVNKDKSKKQTEKKSATSKEEGEIMTTVDDRWPFSTNMEQTGDELSTVPSVEMEGITNEQNAESLTKKPTERREKRSAHHEPGHEGHDHTDDTNHQHSDHDHTDHQHMDHDHHDHSQGEKRSSASYVVFSSTFLLFCIVISMYL